MLYRLGWILKSEEKWSKGSNTRIDEKNKSFLILFRKCNSFLNKWIWSYSISKLKVNSNSERLIVDGYKHINHYNLLSRSERSQLNNIYNKIRSESKKDKKQKEVRLRVVNESVIIVCETKEITRIN